MRLCSSKNCSRRFTSSLNRNRKRGKKKGIEEKGENAGNDGKEKKGGKVRKGRREGKEEKGGKKEKSSETYSTMSQVKRKPSTFR